MKRSLIFFAVSIAVVLCAYLAGAEANDVAVRGKIYFSDYYSMGGEKCSAFLEAEDGTLFCVLDTMEANGLRSDMGSVPGDVRVVGSMEKDTTGSYLKIKEYDITGKKSLSLSE